MGSAMAGHVLDQGYELTVHTRTPARAQPLLNRGAAWAATPAAATSGMDVVCSIVALPSDVEAIYLGESSILSAPNPPPIAIDLTTSGPGLAATIAAAGERVGTACLDAPVSGGDVGAKQGTLSIMVGGDVEALAAAMPILETFGATIVHQGPPGAGQHTKVVNQILVAAGMVGLAEALLYADRAGLDARRVLDSVGSGAAGSWAVTNLAPRIIDGDFEPGFFIDHLVKDLRIASETAAGHGLELSGLSLARRLYDRAVEAGMGRKGTQALYALLDGGE
jgi:3-hydroxyisobutyrate dehydrogenase